MENLVEAIVESGNAFPVDLETFLPILGFTSTDAALDSMTLWTPNEDYRLSVEEARSGQRRLYARLTIQAFAELLRFSPNSVGGQDILRRLVDTLVRRNRCLNRVVENYQSRGNAGDIYRADTIPIE